MRSESDISGKYFQIEKKKISRDTFVNFENRQVLFFTTTDSLITVVSLLNVFRDHLIINCGRIILGF